MLYDIRTACMIIIISFLYEKVFIFTYVILHNFFAKIISNILYIGQSINLIITDNIYVVWGDIY